MKSFLVLFLMVLSSGVTLNAAEDWGATGHRATGEIAANHVSKRTKRAIAKLLDGQSLAFVSTYGDDIKSDKNYRKYGPWHYVNFPFGSSYEETPKSDRGDLVNAIETCISVLKNDSSSKEDKVFHLKMLVHFIGDLHQPMHVGIADDKGGNDFQVRWFGDGTNLHSVWDTKMIESYNMSYSELAANSPNLSKQQLADIKKGDLLDWVNESRSICEDIYAGTTSGEKLSYQYMYQYVPVVRSQLQKGGIRLASILDSIFN